MRRLWRSMQVSRHEGSDWRKGGNLRVEVVRVRRTSGKALNLKGHNGLHGRSCIILYIELTAT